MGRPWIVIGLVVVALGATTASALTLRQPSNSAFATGNLELSIAPASALLRIDGFAPGDRMAAPIEIRNDGTLPLSYSIISSTNGPEARVLTEQLDLTIGTGPCSVGLHGRAGFCTDPPTSGARAGSA